MISRPIGSTSSGGGGADITEWSALPAGTEGDTLNATLEALPVVAGRGSLYWHPAYPTKAQLESLWPDADQEDGVRVGPMSKYWQARAEQRALKVLIIGDSNTMGQEATVNNTGCRDVSWPAVMAASLGWRDGCAASGQLANGDSRVVNNGWTVQLREICGSLWVHNNSAADLAFSPAVPFDSLVITGVAINNNNATTTVLVDGVSVGTINHNVGLNGYIDLPQLSVTVARGLHTVTCRSGGSGGNCYINTFETYDSQSIIPDLLHFGTCDSNISDHIAQGQWKNRGRLRQIRADVVLFMGTINDLDDSIPVATITAGMTTLAGYVHECGGVFIGICGWATNRANVTKTNLDLLSAHLKALSQADGTAWIDTRAALGYTYAETDPVDVADTAHLTIQGYAKQAEIVAKAFG